MQSSQVNRFSAHWAGSGVRARSGSGFTLIELLVVIAIVAILAAIAYPSYRTQVTKTRRADAQAVLMQAAQFMERTYTENGTYAPTGFTFPDAYKGSPMDGAIKYYTISLPSSSASTFVIRAKGTGPESGVDTLAINETGQRWYDTTENNTKDTGEGVW